jgi:hydroxypyruvate isomerase
MPRFAANLSTLYPEHPLLARIGAAARDGFAAVEVQSPYAVAADDFARALREARIPLVLMNAPQGDFDAGERGLAALPGREAEFDASIAQALDYARVVQAPRVHVMAGKPPADASTDGSTDAPTNALADNCRRTYLRNLGRACDALAPHGIDVTIEPINTRDLPGYWLTQPQQAADLIAQLARPNLRLQFDCYHVQIMRGDLTRNLERYMSLIGHVQIAGVPDRHEPDTGEVLYPAVYARLDALGYAGWVGCEYRPARGAVPGGTSAGLTWLRRV